jgi:DeoR family transcriptional regulator, aga operon transcriptional repressor
MVRRAQREIAVVDHSKFGVVAGWRICATSELNALITDSGATDEMVAAFETAQIEVMRG